MTGSNYLDNSVGDENRPRGGYASPAPHTHQRPPPISKTPLLIGSVVALFIAVGVGVFFFIQGEAQAGEVFLVPAASAGPDPFSTAPFAAPPDPALAQPATEAAAPIRPTASVPVSATNGAQPGLYGGTMDKGACDPTQMVSFLATNPSKAQAWVDALTADPAVALPSGRPLTVATIPDYVAGLTSIVLIADTRVTNHGFKRGRANPLQSVLQKGSAVMIDAYGVPRVKCYCGNPLLPPVPSSRPPTYQGPRWPDFDPNNVRVVTPPPHPVQTFVLVDPTTGGRITVPAGTAVPSGKGAVTSNPPTATGPGLRQTVRDNGRFELAIPADNWRSNTTGTSSSTGAPIIRVSPEIDVYTNKSATVPGFSLTDLTDVPMTPPGYLSTIVAASEYPGCQAGPEAPFAEGSFSGTARRLGPCGAFGQQYSARDWVSVVVGVTGPNGEQIAGVMDVPTGYPESEVERRFRDALRSARRR